MAEPENADDERAEFFDGILAAGLLVGGGVDGVYQSSGAFEQVVRAIESLVSATAEGTGGPQRFLPPIMSRDAFERTGYLRSFPDLLGAIEVFEGGDADHAALLLEASADDADWISRLTPTDVVLSSAACHPLYGTLPKHLPDGGARYEVQGFCFRHEPSKDPARMQSFRQHEFVFIGEPADALTHRNRWLERGFELLTSLDLDVRIEEANDPFFGRAGRILASSQRASALKYEITCPVSSTRLRTAIASANYHESHFGDAFGISTAGGTPAHSACIGFGLERIALALFRRHGVDESAWPVEIRGLLGV